MDVTNTARLLIVSTVATTLRAFLLPYADHFRSLGWQVDAAAYGASGDEVCRPSFDHLYDVEWSRSLRQPKRLLAAARSVRLLVNNGRYDIVHVHTPIASFVTRYALRNLHSRGGPQVIYTAHGFHFHPGGHPAKNLAYRTLEKLAGRWTDYLVVLSREDEDAARRYGIVLADRVVYMPGIGVDTARYAPHRVSASAVEQIRGELGLGPADRLFLMIAEFNPGKCHRDLLHALALLNHADVHLALAGTGPLLEEMRQLARTLNIAERVHFLGFRSDVPTLIRASVATVLPSEREGLPRSILESLALETPVIGTEIRGVRDLLSPGCGLLVPLGSPDRLAEAMQTLLNNPEQCRAMGKLGREHVAAYDIAHIVRLHETLYLRALCDHS